MGATIHHVQVGDEVGCKDSGDGVIVVGPRITFVLSDEA